MHVLWVHVSKQQSIIIAENAKAIKLSDEALQKTVDQLKFKSTQMMEERSKFLKSFETLATTTSELLFKFYSLGEQLATIPKKCDCTSACHDDYQVRLAAYERIRTETEKYLNQMKSPRFASVLRSKHEYYSQLLQDAGL